MKNHIKVRLLAAMAFLFAILYGCSPKSVEPAATSLEITVIDLNTKKPVEGAGVSLYNTYQAWVNGDNPTIKAIKTNIGGVATFSPIDTATYYVDVSKGALDNYAAEKSDTEIGPLVVNQVNKKTVYIW